MERNRTLTCRAVPSCDLSMALFQTIGDGALSGETLHMETLGQFLQLSRCFQICLHPLSLKHYWTSFKTNFSCPIKKRVMYRCQHQNSPILPEWFVTTCNSFFLAVCSYLHILLRLWYKEKCIYVCMYACTLNSMQSVMLTLKLATENCFA